MKARGKKWYHDPKMLALASGFVSTTVTILNLLVNIAKKVP
jgi:hypothetical protein